jgi:hypothetical protein
MIRAVQSVLKQMRSYQEAECDIPTYGIAAGMLDELETAIGKERTRRTKVKRKLQRSISLQKLEAILYRESSCIAACDVPLLMAVFYSEAGIAPPQRLEREVEESKQAVY